MKLGDLAYTKIKEMIKSRKFRPGDPLPESELCLILNMSRTPIRQALHKLQDEQLVKIQPRRGAFVATIDLKELCNIYEAREAIKGMLVNLNCRPHIKIDEYIELKESIIKEMENTNSSEKLINLDKLSRRLINLIKKNSENPVLEKFSDIIIEQLNTLAEVTQTIPKFLEESVPEHIEILDAIIEKDSKKAELVARDHVKSAFSRVLKRMNS